MAYFLIHPKILAIIPSPAHGGHHISCFITIPACDRQKAYEYCTQHSSKMLMCGKKQQQVVKII